MLIWFFLLFLILVLLNAVTPWLHKLGFGKLPGDFIFRGLGRNWYLPLSSTVVFSLIVSGLSKFFWPD